MDSNERLDGKLDNLELRLGALSRAIGSLETTVRAEQQITEKHDGLLRGVSELVATLNLSIRGLEKSVNGLPVRVAEQARDIERLSARLESLSVRLEQNTAAEIAGRYGNSRAWIGLLGSAIGAAVVWFLSH